MAAAPSPSPAPFENDPERLLPVRLDPGAVDAEAALSVVRVALPEWADLRAEDVEWTPITGGITNALGVLTAPGRSAVLVRVYGPQTQRVIDRDRENRLFARLAAGGAAPPYLARFENGRVEGYLVETRPLEPAEMGHPRWQAAIARQLAALHRWSLAEAGLPEAPRTFETLRGWLDEARAVRFSGERAETWAALELEARAADLHRLEAVWRDDLAPAATGPGAAQAARTVLAHNDLLSGNVLVDDQTGAVAFIDFEYADAGVAGFDVANHFCEYAGFDSDFARGFPGDASRRAFAAAYLGGAPSPEALAAFDRLVRFFVLVNHLWWGSWAVVQARYSPIDFDFLGYARLRFAGWRFHREQWGPTGEG